MNIIQLLKFLHLVCFSWSRAEQRRGEKWRNRRITQHTTSPTRPTRMASRSPSAIGAPPQKGYYILFVLIVLCWTVCVAKFESEFLLLLFRWIQSFWGIRGTRGSTIRTAARAQARNSRYGITALRIGKSTGYQDLISYWQINFLAGTVDCGIFWLTLLTSILSSF